MLLKPYVATNQKGSDTAAEGIWKVTGPGIDALYTTDRTRAKVITRALNQAYEAGAAAALQREERGPG